MRELIMEGSAEVTLLSEHRELGVSVCLGDGLSLRRTATGTVKAQTPIRPSGGTGKRPVFEKHPP
jgi:hypothetical protein